MLWLPLFYQVSFFYLFFRTSQQDVLFGKYCLSKYNFLFHFFLLLPPKTFFYIGFTTSCRNDAAAEAEVLLEILYPFLSYIFFPFFFFALQCTRHLYLQIVFLSFQHIFVSLIDCICSMS